MRDLFNPDSGNGMSYVRIPVSLMSDFMARDGGGDMTALLTNILILTTDESS